MNKCSVSVSVFAAVLAAQAATVSDIVVRQQWPWSREVKIDYTLSGVTGPTDVKVTFYNGAEKLTSASLHNLLKGERFGITSDGRKTLRLDPVAAFGKSAGSFANFRAELETSDSPANSSEVLYRIYDLKGVKTYSGSAPTEVTRADILNGKYGDYETDFSRIGSGFNTTLKDVLIWTGVTNGWTYKTDKLVMRKIPAAGVDWTIGSPTDEKGRDYSDGKARETQRPVKLTEDYFISVFEITQAQLTNMYNSAPAVFKDKPDSPVRPFIGFAYNDVRGQIGWGDVSATSGQKINWPTNVPQHAVFPNRLAGYMRTYLRKDKNAPKTMFDLPTEAQWEFACRAGTTNALNSGKEILHTNASVCRNTDEVAWNDYSTYPDNEHQVMQVGMKKPNAFGLYDMHGNAEEVCLDCYSEDISNFYDLDPETGTYKNFIHEGTLVDPVGPSSVIFTDPGKPTRTRRGGCIGHGQRYQRSAYRINYWGQEGRSDANSRMDGLRLVCPAAADWSK